MARPIPRIARWGRIALGASSQKLLSLLGHWCYEGPVFMRYLKSPSRNASRSRAAGCALDVLESRRLLAEVFPVGGFVFNDPSGAGSYNGSNLPNRVVWADLNTDGVRDANEPAATTGTDGQAYILNLEAGRYLL